MLFLSPLQCATTALSTVAQVVTACKKRFLTPATAGKLVDASLTFLQVQLVAHLPACVFPSHRCPAEIICV